ncbi:hypothetical protein SUGI_0948090 [Cryptomeria japonica]|nr:hypothetical protein SUGI_0948090 [Cryptomeria japonica]
MRRRLAVGARGRGGRMGELLRLVLVQGGEWVEMVEEVEVELEEAKGEEEERREEERGEDARGEVMEMDGPQAVEGRPRRRVRKTVVPILIPPRSKRRQ